METKKQYDVIIIGGSYSGLAAGMALGRALRNVLIIDGGRPCNRQTPHSHNFLTNDGKTPNEIAAIARKQVQKYNTVSFLEDMATTVSKIENRFEIETQTGEAFATRKIILATGIKDIMPNIDGFAESWGKTVLHCPYCHGYEVRHEKTGVLPIGDNGFELASLISNWTDDLTLFTNGKSALDQQEKEKMERHKIRIDERSIERIEHKNGHIENIVFNDKSKVSVKALYARVSFEQHSGILQTLDCELTPEGYIKINTAYRTSVEGVYACGDNVTRMRTVANAVSMGTTTGLMVNRDLIEEDF